MIFDHMVKYNGQYYNAGQDVPIGECSAPLNKEETHTKEDSLTKEQLMEMTVKNIKALADEKGFVITKTAKADIVDEFYTQQ